MMDVLAVYEKPYDARYPVICLDEKSKQLIDDVRNQQPVQAGKPRRIDFEYKRNGTINLFAAVEPKAGTRHITVTKRRTKNDFATWIRWLVTQPYRNAKKIIMVLDNLNTHTEKAIQETFGTEEAEALLKRIEFHHTPKHASWLNQVEIELAALSTQCLSQRIPTFQDMQHQVAVWQRERNMHRIGINWTFTREKARQKFHLIGNQD